MTAAEPRLVFRAMLFENDLTVERRRLERLNKIGGALPEFLRTAPNQLCEAE